jgi:hypothetical protein
VAESSEFFAINRAQAFAQFSKRSLLDRKHSRALLSRLRGSRLPEIQQIVALIDRYNRGLEQEALLV